MEINQFSGDSEALKRALYRFEARFLSHNQFRCILTAPKSAVQKLRFKFCFNCTIEEISAGIHIRCRIVPSIGSCMTFLLFIFVSAASFFITRDMDDLTFPVLFSLAINIFAYCTYAWQRLECIELFQKKLDNK